MPLGEIASLGCAVLWAGSTIAMRSQTARVPVLAINALRTAYASLIVWGLLLLLGRIDGLFGVPPQALGGLMLSVLIGMALGDSLQLRASHAIGVSRALPISSSYPLLTAVLAVLFLGEPITWRIVLGILLVVGGVYLVAFPRRGRVVEGTRPASLAGVGMALGASVCWSLSTVLVRPALDLVDPFVANGLRLPAAFLVLWLLGIRSEGSVNLLRFGRRSGAILAVAGMMSGISGALWLYGVLHAGAAKAATLSSTAPVFAAPLAALLLGERLSIQTGLGILLALVGVWMVL